VDSVSVILPVYNEVLLLKPAIDQCLNALSARFEDFEVIVIEDGSIDGTGSLADRIAGEGHRVTVLHNGINLNLGISILRGFSAAQKDLIVFNSVDLPLAPHDIAGLAAQMSDCDVLVCERLAYEGATAWRRLTSFLNRLLLHALFPVLTRNLRDMNFTLMFRRSVRTALMPLARSPAFTQVEMILRARRLKLKVKVVSVAYHSRTLGKGALGRPHDIIWTLCDMLRFRIRSILTDDEYRKTAR
jgi:glycosyltransferase involved in cell wall biosynthesis